jgi:hypothetical protein
MRQNQTSRDRDPLAGVNPKRLFNAERLTIKAVFSNRSLGPTVTVAQPDPQPQSER